MFNTFQKSFQFLTKCAAVHTGHETLKIFDRLLHLLFLLSLSCGIALMQNSIIMQKTDLSERSYLIFVIPRSNPSILPCYWRRHYSMHLHSTVILMLSVWVNPLAVTTHMYVPAWHICTEEMKRTLKVPLVSVVLVMPDFDFRSLLEWLQVKLPITLLEQLRLNSDPIMAGVPDELIVTAGIRTGDGVWDE